MDHQIQKNRRPENECGMFQRINFFTINAGSRFLHTILAFVLCSISPLWVKPATAQVRADFNGDLIGDVAIGVLEDPAGILDAGTVHVFYGSLGGLAAAGNSIWHQNSPGPIADAAEMYDSFGAALAAGDFNDDGFDDLAIGVPLEDVGAIVDAGAVNVIYGSAGGLTAAGNQFWNQNSAGIADAAEASDQFGHALASNDFNGDGYDDLAIGVPLENVGAIVDAGAVNVIYGSAAGLVAAGNQFWNQNSPGPIADMSEGGDNFGFALASCDFGGDGYDDLAIGVPLENVGAIVDAGAVNVIYGSAAGLAPASNEFWHQDAGTIKDVAEAGDFFGYALTVGNFNGDVQEYDNCDLTIGVPGEDVVAAADAGAVNVVYGSMAGGLTDFLNQFWHQDELTMVDTSEAGDGFGSSLTSGDFAGDSYDDLVVGVWYEDLAFADQGAVSVLYGSAGTGLTDLGNQLWNEDSPGILGVGAASDLFSSALTSDDFNGDMYDDLVATVPYEEIGAIVDAGAMNAIYGSAVIGLDSPGNQRWHQNSAGIGGVAGANDNFGFSASVSSTSMMTLNPSRVSESRERNLENPHAMESSGEVIPSHLVTSGSVLGANYPNPFNPSTAISYSINEVGPVKLTVYNVLGQLVATLVDQPEHPAGQFDVRFDAARLSSGLYVYRLESKAGVQSKSMLLIK